MSFWWCFRLILCSSGIVSSFPANDIVNEPRTKSHSSITLEAIYRATATFLDREGLVNDTEQSPSLKVSKFFGADGNSLQTFISMIREISSHMSSLKRDKTINSYYHVNAEQIRTAHLIINGLRSEVQKLSKNVTIVKNNVTLIREKIAHILYIIQEFYSNTNWIELYGISICEDFGQTSILKVEIATQKENTCTNCKNINGVERCENNTLGTKLTSGYKSGQDAIKPMRHVQGNDGKCSHGTRDDTSRNLTATGGIYKGRSIQTEAPHSYLHKEATEAAVKATEYYLTEKDRGLLRMMGKEVFRDVFSIHTREDIVKTSLTFVIDITGSMGDDIEGVQSATKKIVNEAKDSTFVPNNYILVTFSDPANLTTGRNTSDPYTMLNWLDYIFVSGGGDCAEYAMTGMLKGIEMSNNNSKIYLITDADAKDEYLRSEVVKGLIEKNLKPVFFITGQCSRRKRDIAQQYCFSSQDQSRKRANFHRGKRSSTSVFESIARETGGKVYEISVTEVEIVVEKEIKETFPSSNVFITWFEMAIGPLNSTTVSIPVDGYIETLKISIKPVTLKSQVALYYPNGTTVSFISKNEQTELSGNVLTLSVRNPDAGKWELKKNETQTWVANVTAQSALDFSIDVLEVTSEGNSYQLSGNPIKGSRYSLVVDIQNLKANSSCSRVVLLDDRGNDVNEVVVTRMPYIGIARYMGDFVPFNKSSFVQIRGTDELGNVFLRTRLLLIIPVSLKLHIMPLLGDLRLYQESNISFSLTNNGESTVEFVVTISDGNADVSVQQGSLDSGEIYNGVVMVTPQSLQTQLLNFYVTLENHTGTIQSEKRRYSVSDTRTADCTVTEYPKMCPLESLNTENCSAYNWTGSVEVSSATIQESDIKVSTDEVVIDHMNLTDANFSVVISISGHCCIQSVVLSITDKNSYFDQCHFVLSEKPLTVVRNPTTEIPTTEKETTTETEITTREFKTMPPVISTDIQVSMSYPTSDISTTGKNTLSVNGTDKQTQDDISPVIGMALGFSFLGLILVVFLVILFCKIKGHANYKFPVVLSKYRTLNEGGRKVLEVDVKLSGFQNPSYKDHSAEDDEIVSTIPQGSESEKNMIEDKSISLNSTDHEKGDLSSVANHNVAFDFQENNEKETNEKEQTKSTTSPNPDKISNIDQKPATNPAMEETSPTENLRVLSDGPSPAQTSN